MWAFRLASNLGGSCVSHFFFETVGAFLFFSSALMFQIDCVSIGRTTLSQLFSGYDRVSRLFFLIWSHWIDLPKTGGHVAALGPHCSHQQCSALARASFTRIARACSTHTMVRIESSCFWGEHSDAVIWSIGPISNVYAFAFVGNCCYRFSSWSVMYCVLGGSQRPYGDSSIQVQPILFAIRWNWNLSACMEIAGGIVGSHMIIVVFIFLAAFVCPNNVIFSNRSIVEPFGWW